MLLEKILAAYIATLIALGVFALAIFMAAITPYPSIALIILILAQVGILTYLAINEKFSYKIKLGEGDEAQ